MESIGPLKKPKRSSERLVDSGWSTTDEADLTTKEKMMTMFMDAKQEFKDAYAEQRLAHRAFVSSPSETTAAALDEAIAIQQDALRHVQACYRLARVVGLID